MNATAELCMDTTAPCVDTPRETASPIGAGGHAKIAPRPGTIEETGLGEAFLCELLAKHLYEGGVLDLGQLAARCALAGSILEKLLGFLREQAWIEVRRAEDDSVGLRFALTDRGRVAAMDALTKSGYVGPAPVPLDTYCRIVRAQSVHDVTATRETVRAAFADVVIRSSLLDQLGPALHSGRAMFVYGAAGSGKTFISRRLARLLGGDVLLPHSIAVRDTVVQLFDPQVHRPVDDGESSAIASVMMGQGYDPRFVRCERPVIVTGGELTLDLLDVRFDASIKEYQAPLQLKASNGMFLIDDLGRQRVDTIDLLNRWIVPMEEQRDYLNLGAGRHFEVPFDVALVFSTNMNPLELADEAFLRRLGYKIRFEYLDLSEYEAIWRQVNIERGIEFDPKILRFVVHELHHKNGVPLAPCHPRDLLGLAYDCSIYQGEPGVITTERLRWAWDNYFIQLSDETVQDWATSATDQGKRS